jgi:hypothetical protein
MLPAWLTPVLLLSTTGTSSNFTPEAQPASTAVNESAHIKFFIFISLLNGKRVACNG